MRVCFFAIFLAIPCLGSPHQSEILWDQYGVPHIYAHDRESMFYAEGWAQMHNQANLLLRLYGESRGRAAEYWGPPYAELDRWLQVNGVPDRAKVWYAAQDPTFRTYLDAFAEGINDYAKAHPESIDPELRVVLPVSGLDVVGHSLRAVHYMYMGSMERMHREVAEFLKSRAKSTQTADGRIPKAAIDPLSNLAVPQDIPGSNTWAVGPPRSAAGTAMLIINPHLAWGETFYRYMEVHMVGPDYDLYGAPQIGFPTPVVGFNRQSGWGRTVNTIDTVDFYDLTIRDGKYEFDGQLRPFETETKVIRIKQPDGRFQEETLKIRRSILGPVVYSDHGVTIAMRVAGLDRPKMLEQWFRMGGARNLEEFKDALRMMAVPMWNANYADSDGHIMIVFDGLVPKRKRGDFGYWSKVVAGNTSETLWTDYLAFDELPKSIDPPSGFHQNTNEPPWSMTLPELDRSKYAEYVSPDFTLSFRTKRSLRMLSEEKSFTYEKLLAAKHSTRMEIADALLPDLLQAAGTSTSPTVRQAAAVLKAWDRNTDTYSRGAVLFQMFADRYFLNSNFNDKLRVPFKAVDPLNTAYGLADTSAALKALEDAAVACQAAYGSLDVPWGAVYRVASGNTDLPGNGGDGVMGVFRTIRYSRPEGKQIYATHGETFVCAIEFSKPQKAQCLLSYGNASQHGSIHLEDQLPLLVEKRLHPVWRDKKDVELHLEQRETFQ